MNDYQIIWTESITYVGDTKFFNSCHFRSEWKVQHPKHKLLQLLSGPSWDNQIFDNLNFVYFSPLNSTKVSLETTSDFSLCRSFSLTWRRRWQKSLNPSMSITINAFVTCGGWVPRNMVDWNCWAQTQTARTPKSPPYLRASHEPRPPEKPYPSPRPSTLHTELEEQWKSTE